MGKQVFCQGDRAKVIYLHNSSVYFKTRFFCQAALANPCIVDEHINVSENLYGRFNTNGERGRFRQVDWQKPDMRLRFWQAVSFHPLELVLSTGGENQFGPRFG